MKRKDTILIASGFAVIGLCLASLATSYAWFARQDNKVVETIDGSMLRSYFHTADGDGTQENPFVITRPKHFENLSWLHNNVEGFDEAGFYFEIGYKFDGQNYQVYDYSDAGTPTGGYAESLNLNYLQDIVPIGTSAKPFIGHLEGHGLEVRNFTIQSKDDNNHGYSDVGIFGYVGAAGTCTNTYFNDFVIDISDCDSQETLAGEHASHDEETVNIGYLAGHIADARNFTNVYVNNCSYESDNGAGNNKTKSVFGYYGKVDKDNSGEGTAGGDHFNFTFDSSAFYNYINNNWNANNYISNGYIRNQSNNESFTRNTEYASEYAPGSTKAFNGTAMDSSYSWVAGTTYNLHGTAPGDTSPSRNFSMSTLGYHTAGQFTGEKEYNAKYLKNGQYEQLPADSVLTTYAYGQNGTGGDPNDPTKVTDFHYYNEASTKWECYRTNDYYSAEQNRSITFKIPNTLKYSFSSFSSFAKTENGYMITDIYLDDNPNPITSIRNDIYVKITASGFFIYTNTVNISITSGEQSFTMSNLYKGTHYVAAVSKMYYPESSGGTIGFRDSFVLGTVNSGAITPAGYQLTTSSSTTVTMNNNNLQRSTSSFTYVTTECQRYIEKGSINEGPYDMYAFTLDGSQRFQMRPNASDETKNFDNTVRFGAVNMGPDEYGVDVIQMHAFVTYHYTVEHGDIYFADEQAILDSGYNPNNLDIVGGGISFSQDYCTLVAERPNASQITTKVIPNDDVINNRQFYATKYCPNSIVMYLRNLNDSDGTMGTVDIYYALNLGQIFGWKSKQPSFKKGYDSTIGDTDFSKSFINFNYFNTTEHPNDYVDTTGGIDRVSQIRVRRDTVQMASYCAIDKDGKLIAKYDYQGELVALASGKTEKDIYSYVLAVGVLADTSSIKINTRITKIDFKFNAEGHSGSFGSVDYRSKDQSTPEVTTNILNFIFIAPKECNYLIAVSYESVGDYGTYSVTATLLSGTGFNITFNLYDTNYTLIVNGQDITSSSASVEIT